MTWQRVWHNFLTGLVAGFFIILPAFLTIIILKLILNWFFGWFINPIVEMFVPYIEPGWALFLAKATIVVGLLVSVALLGFAARMLVFRRFLKIGEDLFRRVPLVGKIYNMMWEIAHAFGGSGRGLFSRVVLLEWPRKGLYTLGFVTAEAKGEVQEKTPEYVVNVFIPTTPTPTSGYLILAGPEMLIPLDMTVEDGMKLVISGGLVGPLVKTAHAKGDLLGGGSSDAKN